MTDSGSYTFEVEIRDTQSHTSTDAGSDADVTVLTDEVTAGDFESYSKFRVFVHDTHDQSFDANIQATSSDDDSWSAPAQLASVGPFDSQDFVDAVQFDGPVGDIRIKTTAPSTAPATGSVRVTIEAVN